MGEDGIIGRGPEQEAIARFLDPSRHGPSALFLLGEPGIGKTTLWQHAHEEAARLAYRTLSCRPAQAETKLSFAGLTDLLDGVEEEAFDALPAPQRRAIDAALLREEHEPDGVDERGVSAGLVAMLRTLAHSGPLLVAVDDAQWLDPPSERVLGFALRRLEREPVRLLAVERLERGEARRAGLIQAVPRDWVEKLFLRPLALEELDGLLQVRLEARLLRPVLKKLHEMSGGNPFYALEIGRALQRREAWGTAASSLPLPDNIGDLVRERLALLPPGAAKAVQVASMLSEPTVSALRAVDGEGTTEALLAASRLGVIDLEGDLVRFTHPLLAAVAYADIPEDERRSLHLALAGVVKGAEQQARHLALGTVGTDARVADRLEVAATQAAARGAPSSAAELADLARGLTPEDDTGGSWRRSIFAAENYIDCGDMPRARATLNDVLAAMPRGAKRARALMLLGDWSDEPRSAIDLLKGGLRQAQDDAALEVEIRCSLVGQFLSLGEIPTALKNALTGLELAEKIGERGLVAEALVRVAEAELLHGKGLRVDLTRRALDIGLSSRQMLTVCWMHNATGDIDGARSKLTDLLARVRERGEETLEAGTLLQLSDLEYRAGHWRLAYQHAESGHALALKTGWEPFLPWGLATIAKIRAGLGELDAARAAARESIERFTAAGQTLYSIVFPLPVLGFIELSAGNPKGALEHLGRLAERCTSAGLGEPGYLRFVPDEVEALVELGRLHEAASELQTFEERSRELDRPYGLAMAARCRGLISAANGDMGAAHELLEEALREHDRMREPFEVGRTLLVMGEVKRRRKQKRAAHQSLAEALQIFEGLGATMWTHRVREAMSRLGKAPPKPWDLTPTEQAIADLVAVGRTNQEVADALFVSTKTVAANLTRIYGKLGIRGRTELAGRLAAVGSIHASAPG